MDHMLIETIHSKAMDKEKSCQNAPNKQQYPEVKIRNETMGKQTKNNQN